MSDIPSAVRMGSVDNLKAGSFGVILGRDLARQLRVGPGDKVTLIVSKGNVTPAGFVPRMKQMTVMGLVDSGHYEFDSTLCVMNVKDALRSFVRRSHRHTAEAFRYERSSGCRALHSCAFALGLVRHRLDRAKPHLVCGRSGGKDHDVDSFFF